MTFQRGFMNNRRRGIGMTDSTQSVPESPCVSICALDSNDVCMGCFRTGDEIVDWFTADPERKREILRASTKRREASDSLF
jgi:predicted Fe-S protein YdhL (DUF1289 family)